MEDLRTWFSEQRGRQTELAKALSVFPSTFSSWDRVPAERVQDVSRVTGIPAHKLRPDVFPAPMAEPAVTPLQPQEA